MVIAIEHDEFGRQCGSKKFNTLREVAYEVGRTAAANGSHFAARYAVNGAIIGRNEDGYADGYEAGLIEKANHEAYLESDAKNFEEWQNRNLAAAKE